MTWFRKEQYEPLDPQDLSPLQIEKRLSMQV
jgi:hypothetical protein